MRYSLRAYYMLAFGCCERGFCVVRFACFLCLLSDVAGAALAVSASRWLCVGFPFRKRGSGICRRFGFQRFVSVVVGAALALGFCDGSGAEL